MRRTLIVVALVCFVLAAFAGMLASEGVVDAAMSKPVAELGDAIGAVIAPIPRVFRHLDFVRAVDRDDRVRLLLHRAGDLRGDGGAV